MNILIVDDDREDAQILYEAIKEVLPSANCRICHSPKAALETVENFTPEFTFLDAIMYPTGGKEVLRDLAEYPTLKNCTFIVMSGVIHPDHIAEFTTIGANFVVAKPSTYSTLLQFIQDILVTNVLQIRVKLFTNEMLVHDQTSSLQKILNRNIDFDISLNVQPTRQNIQFYVSESELTQIKTQLGYNLLLMKGGHWLPNI